MIPPEGIVELSWCAGRVKRVFGSNESDLVLGDACTPKWHDDVVLGAPSHRTDESLRRRLGVRGAEPETLRDQRLTVGDPVTHDDATAGTGHGHQFLRNVERLRRPHRTENADDGIEGVIIQLL